MIDWLIRLLATKKPVRVVCELQTGDRIRGDLVAVDSCGVIVEPNKEWAVTIPWTSLTHLSVGD